MGTGGVQDGFVALSIVGGDAVDVDVCGQGKRQAGTSGIDVDVAIGVHKAYGLTGGHVKGIAGGVGGVPTQVHFAGKGAVQGFQLRHIHAIGICRTSGHIGDTALTASFANRHFTRSISSHCNRITGRIFRLPSSITNIGTRRHTVHTQGNRIAMCWFRTRTYGYGIVLTGFTLATNGNCIFTCCLRAFNRITPNGNRTIGSGFGSGCRGIAARTNGSGILSSGCTVHTNGGGLLCYGLRSRTNTRRSLTQSTGIGTERHRTCALGFRSHAQSSTEIAFSQTLYTDGHRAMAFRFGVLPLAFYQDNTR